jgi:tRNA (guanine37-N1)-methyltransferase
MGKAAGRETEKVKSMQEAPLLFNVITLFPELIDYWAEIGLIGKSVKSGIIRIRCLSPREFTVDRHRSVDDTPFGGGAGMVMAPGPLVEAMEALDAGGQGLPRAHRVLLTPQGEPMSQQHAARFARMAAVTLVCGRYEGVDERVRAFVDQELSLGDFVLNGGEVAALAVMEATARLLPGVLGNADSPRDESHGRGLLEYPQYTRPRSFREMEVPEVLISGNHAQIERWRRKQALVRTRQRRPDLFQPLQLSEEEQEWLGEHDSGKDDGQGGKG